MGKKARRKRTTSKPHPAQPAPWPRRKKRGLWITGAAALVLLASATYLFLGAQEKRLYAYTPEDVVHGQPIHAVHEMRPGPRIPFLPRSQPQPNIEVPDNSYNFGRVGAHAILERRFIIRNTGDAPLTISRAYTTCGCTTAHLTARVIPPGKVAEVTLIFNAGFHDTRGQRVQRGLIIENNDRRHPKAEIWVRAAVGWS
jgi:hypothetical protein